MNKRTKAKLQAAARRWEWETNRMVGPATHHHHYYYGTRPHRRGHRQVRVNESWAHLFSVAVMMLFLIALAWSIFGTTN